MEDELMDVVDRRDNVIGKKRRSALYAEGSQNSRVINVFLVNEKRQIWTPRRCAHKRLFPMHLDMSCGGHVMSGESYEEAFQREVKEELNIDIRQSTWHLLGHLSPYDHGVSMFMKVYVILGNETPRWNSDDFVEAYWLWPWEIMDRIRAGEKVKGDLPLLVENFFNVPEKNKQCTVTNDPGSLSAFWTEKRILSPGYSREKG